MLSDEVRWLDNYCAQLWVNCPVVKFCVDCFVTTFLCQCWKFSKKSSNLCLRLQQHQALIAMAARQKRKAAEAVEQIPEGQNVIAQFKSIDGETTGPPLNLPVNVTPDQLEMLLNQLMNTVCCSN
jgi:hypothetical protein